MYLSNKVLTCHRIDLAVANRYYQTKQKQVVVKCAFLAFISIFIRYN